MKAKRRCRIAIFIGGMIEIEQQINAKKLNTKRKAKITRLFSCQKFPKQIYH